MFVRTFVTLGTITYELEAEVDRPDWTLTRIDRVVVHGGRVRTTTATAVALAAGEGVYRHEAFDRIESALLRAAEAA